MACSRVNFCFGQGSLGVRIRDQLSERAAAPLIMVLAVRLISAGNWHSFSVTLVPSFSA